MQTEDQKMDTKLEPCKYCGAVNNHLGAKCHLVKSFEYDFAGTLIKVTFFAPNEYMAPLVQPLNPTHPISPVYPSPYIQPYPNPWQPHNPLGPVWMSNNVSYTFGSQGPELLNEHDH